MCASRALGICALGRVEVLQLAGIGLEIVELGLGSIDELGTLLAQCAQGSPSPAQRVVGLAKERAGGLGFAIFFTAFDERNERFPVQFCGRGCVGQKKDGGKNVGGAHQRVDDHAAMGCVRHLNNEWNVEGRVIEKEAVSLLSVLAQAFAMIADNNNDRVPIGARFLQLRDEVAKRGVGVGDLTVVEMRGILFGEGRRRLVRIMGIVEVDPHEARITPGVVVEP